MNEKTEKILVLGVAIELVGMAISIILTPTIETVIVAVSGIIATSVTMLLIWTAANLFVAIAQNNNSNTG